MYDNKRRMSFIHEKTRMKKQMLDNVTYPSQQADNFFLSVPVDLYRNYWSVQIKGSCCKFKDKTKYLSKMRQPYDRYHSSLTFVTWYDFRTDSTLDSLHSNKTISSTCSIWRTRTFYQGTRVWNTMQSIIICNSESFWDWSFI